MDEDRGLNKFKYELRVSMLHTSTLERVD